jgi:sulfopyruvate decarboxylase subunit beta
VQLLQRAEIIDAIVATRNDAVALTSPGVSSGLLWNGGQHPATIYQMELGYTMAVAYGIALGQPDRRVIAVEGDGSFFAGIQLLGTLARFPAANLIIVVVANGIWGTGDANVSTTPCNAAQLAEIARGCGLVAERVVASNDPQAFQTALARAHREPGPWLFIASAERSELDRSGIRPRPLVDTVESVDLTRRYLRDARV